MLLEPPTSVNGRPAAVAHDRRGVPVESVGDPPLGMAKPAAGILLDSLPTGFRYLLRLSRLLVEVY